MAPTVKKAKTAYLYFQADRLGSIRKQLGPEASMGDAMTEVSILFSIKRSLQV